MEITDNIALFDMDGSVANYDAAMVRDLNHLRSPGEPFIDKSLWELEKQPHIAARMALIKNQPGWWFNLEPITQGLAVIGWCKAVGFDIHVLTKGPKKHSNAWAEKVQWCQHYLGPDVDIHVTSDKGMVYGKILYDDYPEYMLRWLKHRPRGLGIMPVTPHNKDFSHPNVIKFEKVNDDVPKIIKAIEIAAKRKSGEPLVL